MKIDNLGESHFFCGLSKVLFTVLMALFYRHSSFERLYRPQDKTITRHAVQGKLVTNLFTPQQETLKVLCETIKCIFINRKTQKHSLALCPEG